MSVERDKFYILKKKLKNYKKLEKTKKNLRIRVHDTLLYKILRVREYHTTTKKIKTQLNITKTHSTRRIKIRTTSSNISRTRNTLFFMNA